jgi:uncharacterized protein YqfA (UPF0365 family)
MDAQELLWVVVGPIIFVFGSIFVLCFKPWLTARLAGAPIPWLVLAGMRFRQTPCGRVVRHYVACVKAGAPVSLEMIEAHFLAGGRLDDTVTAWLAANRTGLKVTWDRICARDLAYQSRGLSVIDWVKSGGPPDWLS